MANKNDYTRKASMASYAKEVPKASRTNNKREEPWIPPSIVAAIERAEAREREATGDGQAPPNVVGHMKDIPIWSSEPATPTQPLTDDRTARTNVGTQGLAGKRAANNTRLYHLNSLSKDYDQLMASVTYDVWGRVTADSISQAEALLKENGFSNINDVKAEIEALNAENWELDNREQYEGLPGQSDFATMSRVPEGYSTSGGAVVSQFDFINNINRARERETVSMAMNGGESPYAAYTYMNDNEIAIYNYLYNTEGQKAANEYLEYIQYYLNARKMADIKAVANWFGQEGGIAASLLSIPAKLMGIAGIADVGVQNLARGLSGEYVPIDYNRAAMTGHVVGQGIRQAKAEKYNAMGTIQLDPEKNPVLARILNGKGWGDVYQLGMGMLDSLATAGLNRIGLGSTATLLLSGSAATQGVLDAVERGASDQQALTIGILNGMAEWFFEKYELDHLLGQDTTYVKAMLNQGATEAFGEGGTGVANAITDVVVMAESSEFAAKVDSYMRMGYSREDATREAFTDTLIEIGWDTAGGFLTGSIMGGGQQIITNKSNAQTQTANQGGQNSLDGAIGAALRGETAQTQQEAPAQAQAEAHAQAPAQTTSAAPAQTPAQAPARTVADSPAVAEALDGYRQNNRVSNNQATAILADKEAVAMLTAQTGMELPGTASGNRAAVKAAVAQLAQTQTQETEAEVQTAKETETAPTEAQEAQETAEETEAAETQGEATPAAEAVESPVAQQEAANPLDRAIGAALRGEKAAAQPEPVNRPQTVDTPKQSPSGAQNPGIKGTGAAEANFSGKQQFENLLGDDNVQPDRASDARPAEMIRRDAQGRRVSDTAKNAVGADVTTEEVVDAIQELAAIGAFSYEEESNRKAMETAGEEIAKRGVRATEREILNRSLNGKHKKGDIEKAMLLYAWYNQKGDVDGASEMMVALTAMANRTGRDLQLFRMMRKLTPEGQLMTVRKTAQQAVDRINRGRDGRKQQEITPKQQLENDYIKAVEASMKDPDNQEKQEAVARAERAIYEDAASQIKSTFADKWNAWRYMAMLGNVRTQVRNVVGNAAFIPYKAAKDTIGSALERMFLKQENRTKAVLNFTAANDRELVSWAAEDGKSRAVHDALKYSAKLGDDNSRNIIEDSRKIFSNKALEAARKFIEKVPQAADMWFKSPYYATSLASFLKARGYTAQQVKSGQVSEAVMQEARSYAIEEAMRATFNDSNAFSDAMSNLRYKGDNRFMKLLNIVGEGVLPFRRTPANVLMRGLEYSPAGLIKTGVQAAEGLRNGDFSGAQFIDNLSANITGSAAMLLGYALAKGMFYPLRLRGGNVDEDEKRRGIQEYAIEFQWNGKTYSYTIDWAAPANLPLFVGANIYEAWSKDYGDDISGFTRFLYAVGNTFEPLLELACLSSLADLAESISYGNQEGNVLYSVAAQIATSYLTQGIPALLRQGHYAAQEDKQTTFANNADPLLRGLERTAANMPIVGSLWQTTKRDAWGRAQDMGGIGVRILNSFVNPGSFRKVSDDPVEAEIARLNRVQSVNVSPDLPGKTITYRDGDGNVHTDHRLTESEWQTLVTTQGQTAHELLTEIVESDAYQSMDDEQRATVIEWVYDYARETGRDAAIRGYEPQLSGWMKDLETFGSGAVFSQAAKREMDDGFTDITAGNRADGFEKLDAGWDIYQSLDQRGRDRFLADNGGRVEYYIHAREAGMSTGTFGNLYTQYRGIDGQDISISQKANAWANTLQKEVEAGHITAEQAAVLKKDMVFRYSGIVATTNYDAMVSAGLSADSAHGVTNLLAGLKPEPGKTTVRDVQNAEAIAGMGMDEKSTVAAMHVYLGDAQDKNLDQMIGMGYSPEDYAAVWRIYLDTTGTGKKNRVIEAIMRELNIRDYKTAAAIYDIYAK